MLLLLTLTAQAQEGYNAGLSADLSLVRRFGGEHPWGVRLGGGAQALGGDACTYYERQTCRENVGVGGSLWPTFAPLFGIGWRGGLRFSTELVAGLGVSSAQVYDFGFIPHWQLLATPGWHWESEGDVHGFTLGGLLTKSLSPTFFQLSSADAVPFALRVGVDAVWAEGMWSPAALASGFQVGMIGSASLE